MPETVPRWEWRTFGDRFGSLEAYFAGLPPSEVVETEELYVLSVADADVVKVRHELMDVKHLLEVDDEGLERWTPVMKTGFPLSATDVAAIVRAAGAEVPAPLPRSAYTLAELLEEVVGPHPDLLAVSVSKRRHRYRVDGCSAELTDVRTEQASTRTVAVESEDATRVVATLGEAGWAPGPNTSFARGLKTLLRFGAGRFAVLDVGTNSVKFHIGERDADARWRTVVDRAEITKLGEGLDQQGRLSPEPVARTLDAIASMTTEARRHGVAAIAAVGTAAMRIAPNSSDLVDAVQERCGVLVEVVSGEEESRLAYRAATAGLPAHGSRVVFDTGGGSSQFTFGHGDSVHERFSVTVGAVRFTEDYGLDGVVSSDVLTAALAAIDADLVLLDGRGSPQTLVGMGGAVTNLAAVKHGLADYDPDVVHGTVLDRAEIERQIELYRTRGTEERRAVAGLQPGRADIILAGACIVRTVLDKLGTNSLTVSDRGLRHGVLIERFG